MKHKTTKKHFEVFKKEVRLWIDRLGLAEWRLDVRHVDTDGNARAWFWADSEGMYAVIGLSPDWGSDNVTQETLKSSAFHEVLHLLFASMTWAANERHVSKGYFEEEEHKVIRRLENTLYNDEGGDDDE